MKRFNLMNGRYYPAPLLSSETTRPLLIEAITKTASPITHGEGIQIVESNGKERRSAFLMLCYQELKRIGCYFVPIPQDEDDFVIAFQQHAQTIFGQHFPSEIKGES